MQVCSPRPHPTPTTSTSPVDTYMLTCWADCFRSNCAGLELLEQNNKTRLERMTPDTEAVRDKHATFSVVQLDVAEHGASPL